MRRGVLVALLACCLAAWTGPAPARAQTAAADSSAVDWERNVNAQRSWVGRILHRYFGRAPRSGVGLAGRAEGLVDRYAPFAGRRIEVVIVYPVLRFDTTAGDSLGTLAGLTRPLWSYTRESVVRQYLLFQAGDRVDPYKLADSERMLRQLDYMNDALIRVVPIGEGDTVAVLVETRDRWPLGVTGDAVTSDQYDGSVYWTNAFGVGLRVDGKAYVHRRRDPGLGFRWLLAKQNLAGTFMDVSVEHEDSWRRRSTSLSVQRPLRHPAIRVVGGYEWLDLNLRDSGDLPRWYVSRDAWVGRVWQLDRDDPFRIAARLGRRRTLTPAVSMAQLDFRDRPPVAREILPDYHNHRTWLGSLTYADLADLRTSYLYRMGETEDVPDGVVLKLTGGYQEGEFRRRALWYGQMALIHATDSGSLAWGSLGAGGFVRRGLFEDGVVSSEAGYVTSLLGNGAWRNRVYARLRWLRGVERTLDGGVALGDVSGIRGLANDRVLGRQRLVLNLESREFTPWRVFGFDTMVFAYGDVGGVADERDFVLGGKIYTSFGLGVRVSNPELVLPPVELRVGLLQRTDGPGLTLAFDLGNAPDLRFALPEPRPGAVAYR